MLDVKSCTVYLQYEEITLSVIHYYEFSYY